jgi:predicted NUDIX family NTP pyrophosphohydrolase
MVEMWAGADSATWTVPSGDVTDSRKDRSVSKSAVLTV